MVYSVAYIIHRATKVPLIGSQWSDGIHQLLHARLNKQYAKQIKSDEMPPFVIDPEVESLTALSSKDFIEIFDSFWALTRTLGSQEEMLELGKQYKAALNRMPTHTTNQLKIDQPILCDNAQSFKQALLAKVADALSKDKKQPILIHAQTIEEANELGQFLLRKIPSLRENLQICHAENTWGESQSHAIQRAGQNGIVTVATLFSRGTDIAVEHPDGLISIYNVVSINHMTSPFYYRLNTI